MYVCGDYYCILIIIVVDFTFKFYFEIFNFNISGGGMGWLFFGYAGGIWKFLGQGLNLCQSSDLNHSSDNARFLTLCASGGLLKVLLLQSLHFF